MVYVPVDFNDPELKVLLNEDWKLSEDKKFISKEFDFKDFITTFSFMTQIALQSEKFNHHPEWFNVYNRLKITWSTHELGGLSQHDLQMAQFCDEVYFKFK